MAALPEFVRKLLLLGHFRWENGALLINQKRAVIFRAEMLVELQDLLEKKIGDGETAELMKELGRKQATSAFERYFKAGIAKRPLPDKSGKSVSEDPVIRAGQLFLETTGWGKFNYLWFKEQKRAMVEVENSPIALAFLEKNQKNERPVCHFLAGLIEGCANATIGMDAECVEKECAAQTGSKKCVFESAFLQPVKKSVA